MQSYVSHIFEFNSAAFSAANSREFLRIEFREAPAFPPRAAALPKVYHHDVHANPEMPLLEKTISPCWSPERRFQLSYHALLLFSWFGKRQSHDE